MADLKQLGDDLKRIDRMIVDLIQRRVDVARFVGFEKMRTGQPIFRSGVEDQRLEEIAEYARSVGVNPNMARSILYALINEACKQQTILLQSTDAIDLETLEGEDRAAALRANLLRLTEVIAPEYDSVFYGDDCFSRIFTGYERDRLAAFADTIGDRDLALDLGCGTGHASLLLGARFRSVIGFDVSPHMCAYAGRNAERSGSANVEFVCRDVETGLPFDDASVALVNMNYGVASDFLDFPALLKEVHRVLRPGGGVFLSFYNGEAVVQKFGFLPWRTGKVSSLNPYTHCLEVNVGGQQIPVHIRPYAIGEVRELLEPRFCLQRSGSYPLLSSILPSHALEVLDKANDLAQLERLIEQRGQDAGGAYLICEAIKRA
jgi:ubiquinone/menaquinone biosynthesis C-methylase UbiE/chorismate mutase